MEKLLPAQQHVDSSSGALESAVKYTLVVLIPIIVKAPANEKIHNQRLNRLWLAMTVDGFDYLSPVGERWGEVCGLAEVARRWTDELVPTLFVLVLGRSPGNIFRGTIACLFHLLEKVKVANIDRTIVMPLALL